MQKHSSIRGNVA